VKRSEQPVFTGDCELLIWDVYFYSSKVRQTLISIQLIKINQIVLIALMRLFIFRGYR